MPSPVMNSEITGLASYLVNQGVLTKARARHIMSDARAGSHTFIHQCCQDRLIDQQLLASAISTVFGLPLLDLSACRPSRAPLELVTRVLIEKTTTLPLGLRGNRIVLAVADPSQYEAVREIEFHSGKPADLVVAPHNQLVESIRELASGGPVRVSPARQPRTPSAQTTTRLLERQATPRPGSDVDSEAPVIRAVNRLLLDATSLNASDIHVEPYEKSFRIRVRIDGTLRDFASPPMHQVGRLIARLKIMARLDISERRLPQDGRIRLYRENQHAVDFRVSTLPTLWGEKTVLRVMDPLRATLKIEQLGFNATQLKLFQSNLARPQGMILVTGPTGSGKTVTLYSALATLNDTTRNISTAEDPIELNLPGINQVQVKPAIGLSFAAALRAFLRQDPDIIMVGEIRDRETVDIAIKAAQTGHLVLSTLHTNSAAETLSRLLGMGIESYNLVSSLSLIIAQRLAKKLCPHCREPVAAPKEFVQASQVRESLLEHGRFFRARGCDRCHEGYRGRIGIYEVVPISEPISRTIIAGGNSMDIAAQAREAGYSSLRQSAVMRMAEGLTSLEEIIRIT